MHKLHKILMSALPILAAPLIAVVSLSQTPTLKIDAVLSGLEKAIAAQTIAKDSGLDRSIHRFLALVETGASPEAAAAQTKVKLAVIRRLEHMGAKSSTASRIATYTTPQQSDHDNTTPQQSDHDKLEVILKRLDAIDAKLDDKTKLVATAQPKAKPDPLVVVTESSSAIATHQESAGTALVPQPSLAALPTLESKPTISTKAEPETIPELQPKHPEPTIINPVEPKPRVAIAQSTGVFKPKIVATHQNMANAIVRGLSVANRTGEIGYSSTLSAKVQNVIRSVRRGEPLPQAVQTAKVPQKTIDRLLVLGHYQAQS